MKRGMGPPLPLASSRARRFWTLALAILAAVACSILGAYLMHRHTRPSAVVVSPPGASGFDPNSLLASLDHASLDPSVAGEFAAAEQAVRLSPQSGEAWGHLGMLCAAYGFRSTAGDIFARAEELNPTDARWPYYQATELCQLGPDAAVVKMQRATELFGQTPQGDLARLRLGGALLHAGRSKEARAEYDKVLHNHSNDGLAHLGLARSLLDAGDAPAALPHAELAEGDPHSGKAAAMIAAQIHQRLNQPVDVKADLALAARTRQDAFPPDPLFDEIAALRTGRFVRFTQLAQLLSHGRADEAIRLGREAVSDQPGSSTAWMLLGRAFLLKQAYADAEEPLTKAIHLESGSADAQFFLGVSLLFQHRHKEAVDHFRAAIGIRPDFAEAYHNLGHGLLGLGDTAGAFDAFRSALRNKPNFVEAHLDLGTLLVREGQPDAAAQEFRAAAALAPSDPRPAELLKGIGK